MDNSNGMAPLARSLSVIPDATSLAAVRRLAAMAVSQKSKESLAKVFREATGSALDKVFDAVKALGARALPFLDGTVATATAVAQDARLSPAIREAALASLSAYGLTRESEQKMAAEVMVEMQPLLDAMDSLGKQAAAGDPAAAQGLADVLGEAAKVRHALSSMAADVPALNAAIERLDKATQAVSRSDTAVRVSGPGMSA